MEAICEEGDEGVKVWSGKRTHADRVTRVAVVDRLATVVVLPEPSVHSEHDEDPGRNYDHGQVVGNHEPADAEWLAVTHEPRAQELDEGDIRQAKGQSGNRTAD